MKLTTLGTSHGDPTEKRFNSCNTLEVGENMYIIDSGVPVNSLFIRKFTNDFSCLRAVFITHMHDDHIGGLPSLIKSVIKYPKEGQHTIVFLPEDVEAPLKGWLKAMHLENFDNLITFKVTKEGFIYENDELKVYAVGTQHIPSENGNITFAYRFEAEGKSLFYTGDLAYGFTDFPEEHLMEKGADLCVCECTHFNPVLVAKATEKLPIKRIVFNHVSNGIATEEGEKEFLGLFENHKFPYSVAKDGDEFEI